MKLIQKIVCGVAFLSLGAQIHLLAQSSANVIDEVIWVVGDEAILLSDVENARMDFGTNIQGNPYCVLPEQLAIQKLFLHQAQLDSIEVSPSNVNAYVEERLNTMVMSAGSKEKLEEYYHMPLSQIREMLYESTEESQIVMMVRENLTKNVQVTPAEVRRYFKDMPSDSLPWIPAQMEVQIITNQPKVPQEEIDRVKGQLRDFSDRVNSGESSFSMLATLYSEDGAARYGGEMPYYGRGELDPAFANVAFNLTDPKKVSKVVESEFGYHIIQLVDKRGDKVKVRHILLKPRLAQEDIDSTLSRLDSIANDIRTEKYTFEEAAYYLSDDKDTRNNHGLMMNYREEQDVRTSRFMLQELPQEVAKVVSEMKEGEISAPFVMVNSKQKEVCAIVKLKVLKPAHRATVTDDFQVLRDALLSKRQAERIDEWIREKQATTYIRINENWRDCDFQYPGWIK